MKRLAISLAAMALYVTSAGAADLGSRRGKPYEPPRLPSIVEDEPKAVGYDTHNWYVGAALGYSWGDEHDHGYAFRSDDTVPVGLYGGYLWRPNSVLGVGIELDYSLRDVGNFNFGDYLASARGRAGLYVTKDIFAYATAGVGRRGILDEEDKHGIVWGGGVDLAMSKQVSMRVEALQFRHDNSHPSNQDDNNLLARVGLTMKLN